MRAAAKRLEFFEKNHRLGAREVDVDDAFFSVGFSSHTKGILHAFVALSISIRAIASSSVLVLIRPARLLLKSRY
jgi:hypothetical protein